VSGDAARWTRRLRLLPVASSDMKAAPSHCLTVMRGGRSTYSGVCGKHTMVRLQISLQASKQLDQSGSKNAGTVYHRLPNDTKENDQRHGYIARCDTGLPSHGPREKKKTQVTNRALGSCVLDIG
jgi:hypothetical protein